MTISDDYRNAQKQLHENPNYGVASLQYAPIVKEVVQQIGATSISDYGAGKCRLRMKLKELGLRKFRYFPFDPAFPEYGEPKEAELVCCIDVLEHVEPFYLDAVLIDLRKITTGHGFFTIHTGPAVKTLADGRNAHLIQNPASWWLPKLCDYFEILHLQASPGGFWIVVSPKNDG